MQSMFILCILFSFGLTARCMSGLSSCRWAPHSSRPQGTSCAPSVTSIQHSTSPCCPGWASSTRRRRWRWMSYSQVSAQGQGSKVNVESWIVSKIIDQTMKRLQIPAMNIHPRVRQMSDILESHEEIQSKFPCVAQTRARCMCAVDRLILRFCNKL